jgi:cell division protein FtsB
MAKRVDTTTWTLNSLERALQEEKAKNVRLEAENVGLEAKVALLEKSLSNAVPKRNENNDEQLEEEDVTLFS